MSVIVFIMYPCMLDMLVCSVASCILSQYTVHLNFPVEKKVKKVIV